MVSSRALRPNKAIYLQLLRAAAQHDVDLTDVGDLIKQELSLSYRLLRYLNSPLFGFVGEIHSIPHALRLLGEDAVRKWLSLVCVAAMGDDKPGELVRVPLIRGRFCELLADAAGLEPLAGDLFLLGLLSLLDAMLDKPLSQILAELPVEEEIKNALLASPAASARCLKWCWIMRAALGNSLSSRRKSPVSIKTPFRRCTPRPSHGPTEFCRRPWLRPPA